MKSSCECVSPSQTFSLDRNIIFGSILFDSYNKGYRFRSGQFLTSRFKSILNRFLFQYSLTVSDEIFDEEAYLWKNNLWYEKKYIISRNKYVNIQYKWKLSVQNFITEVEDQILRVSHLQTKWIIETASLLKKGTMNKISRGNAFR